MHRKQKWISIQEPKGWMIRFSGQVTEEILFVPQLQRVASSIDWNQKFWSMFVVVSDF